MELMETKTWEGFHSDVFKGFMQCYDSYNTVHTCLLLAKQLLACHFCSCSLTLVFFQKRVCVCYCVFSVVLYLTFVVF